jgi:hypothetical protein
MKTLIRVSKENKMNIPIYKNLGPADRNKPGKVVFYLCMLVCALLLAANARATVRSSANFAMQSDVLDSGGGSASSANFKLNSSIGQSMPVGSTSSANFELISGFIPGTSFIIFANDVVLNIPGSGVSILLNDNTSSVLLHADTAEAMAVGDVDNNGEDDVIVSFPAGTGPDNNGGTYISRNQGALVSLDVRTAEGIAAGNFDGLSGDDLLLDFGIDGLSSYMNDTVVSAPLTPESPLTMAVGDVDNSGQDDVVLSFTAFGTVLFPNFNLAAVSVLDPSPAEVLELGDIDGNGEDDIVASFAVGNGPGATGGIFVARNQGLLSLLTTFPAELITSGDFDGTGLDDLVLDLGSVTGLWVYLDDASSQQLTPLTPEAMSAGDVDSSGSDDMVFSFTGNGTFVYKDMTTLETLDPVGVATHLATGKVDGN